MEHEGEFSHVEFDLLGMLFPGDGPDSACTSFSQYSTGDDDRICGRADFEVPANASLNMPGFDEDYSYCSLVNIVDPGFPWDGGFCVPTADFSGVVANNTRVPTADEILPKEDRFAAGEGLKHEKKFVMLGKSADNAIEITETSNKRPRQYRVKRQEGTKTRKNKKPTDVVGKDARDDDKNVECNDNVIGRQNGQSPTSSYSSEVDLNSRQLSGSNDIKDDSSAPLNNMTVAEVKPRARRGSATDPQSLYARRRRERINERLKILQNLIPNGTKIDISTMLEEAVHYVKFLQIQIKLLSSDEMWMYAPIAYNGKNLGLNLNQLFSSQPCCCCCSYQA